jgi:hypothetical protein
MNSDNHKPIAAEQALEFRSPTGSSANRDSPTGGADSQRRLVHILRDAASVQDSLSITLPPPKASEIGFQEITPDKRAWHPFR